MGNTSDTKQANLSLHFNEVGEDPAFDGGSPGYEVKLADATGEGIMQLRLPRQLVEFAVLRNARPVISMAPDGVLSVEFDGHEEVLLPHTNLEIDRLVERSMTPAMLEDERDIEKVLQILRGRLLRALDVVDIALTRLR